MPHRFWHQPYVVWETSPTPTTVAAVRPDQVPEVDVGQTLRWLRVSHIFLVHGTFVGTDPFGVAERIDELTESVPPMLRPVLKTIAIESWGKVLRSINQRLADRAMGETGSFRDDYLQDFRSLLGEDDPKVERFDWSSGNDHVARAEAAIQLFNRLTDLPIDAARERLLLWGHSHAGSVFALLTSLLANDRKSVEQFFEAAGKYADTRADWERTRERLSAATSPHPLAKGLFLVTFGAPVRYGWDRAGYAKLLHIVHHRPVNGLPEYQAQPALPQTTDEIFNAKYGDWVQAFAIAGTDVLPLDREKRELHRALGELFETGLIEPELTGEKTILQHLPAAVQQRVREKLKDILILLERWKCGPRVHNEGDSVWLFDYGEDETAKLGHGVYTKRAWLPFHAARIAEWLLTSTER